MAGASGVRRADVRVIPSLGFHSGFAFQTGYHRAMRVRTYGDAGPLVLVVHGGPGALGDMAPVARGLADTFGVIEPWQRTAAEQPLTVDRHVADLETVVESHCRDERFAVVGHSWGAMLALAWAAACPDRAAPLVLVSCGTFDSDSRAAFKRTVDERLGDAARRRIAALPMQQRFEAIRNVYDYDAVDYAPAPDAPPFDERANAETWRDMVRRQEAGEYPAAFAAVRAPVLMIHGSHDPHPGPATRDTLKRHLPQLEYHELPNCGHDPWRERQAREAFFSRLRRWLAEHLP